MPQPVREPLDKARAALSRDEFVDADGPTITLHGDVADALLTARGWTHRDRAWYAPDGQRYWMRDEALTIALTAEGLR